ncbi:MAG: O-antigen ligase family protein [Planctomycetaceae bacterium]|jgi:tetratricopeptide (TPR) repeat protein|nr:O-antigen ligase family protein [Planctomycetaceae bacterium]
MQIMLLNKIVSGVRFLGQIILAVTVFAAPWCFGGIDPATQYYLFLGVIASLICGLVTLLLDRKNVFSFPTLLLPIFLILFLIGMQLRPYSMEMLAKHSPKAAELRQQLLPSPDSEEYQFTKAIFPETRSSADPAPTSIYPAATRHQLALFFLVLGVLVSAAILFQTRISVTGISIAVAFNGAFLALVGIITRISPSNSFLIYKANSGVYGTFLNRNNTAGYLGMCLGVILFLVFRAVFRSDRETEEIHRWDKRWERKYMTTQQWFAYQFTRFLTAGILNWGLFAVVIVASIFLSLSRGGILAMLTGLVIGFPAVFLTRRFKLPVLGLIVVGVCGAALVAWMGMGERVQKRLESIVMEQNNLRLTNWDNAMQTAKDFQWRGSGFGTYQYANLINDEIAANNHIAVRAENQYVEIFLDLGVIGFLLFFACLVMIITICIRLIRQHKDDELTALGGGMLILVLTQVIASLFDFGLYIVANAMLLALFCGICSVAVPEKNKREQSEKNDWKSSKTSLFSAFSFLSRIGMIGVACFFLVFLFWSQKNIGVLCAIGTAEKHLKEIGKFQDVKPDRLAKVITELETAIQKQPDLAIPLQQLGEAKIALYRLQMSRDLAALPDSELTANEAWNLTALSHIHNQISLFRRMNFSVPTQSIQNHPAVEEFLKPAFCDFIRSRQCHPIAIPPHYRIAEIIPILMKNKPVQKFEEEMIQRMTIVAPQSAQAWYRAGVLERNLGHQQQARSYWKKSLSLSQIYLRSITETLCEDLSVNYAETIFQETYPESPELYMRLLANYFPEKTSPQYFSVILNLFHNVVDSDTEIPQEERHYYRGRYYLLAKDYPHAIEELNKACIVRREQHEWRYYLATAYFNDKQYGKAKNEIQTALFYAPDNRMYQNYQKTILKNW